MTTVTRPVLGALVLAAAVAASATSAVAQDRSASGPLRIAVLIDTSQAMEPHINDMRQALRSFIREMQGNADISLYEFGERPARLANYTRDPVVLEAAVGRVFARPGSGSYSPGRDRRGVA